MSEYCKNCKDMADKLQTPQEELEGARWLLKGALPHIECKNATQSGLITEIGEYLAALKGTE